MQSNLGEFQPPFYGAVAIPQHITSHQTMHDQQEIASSTASTSPGSAILTASDPSKLWNVKVSVIILMNLALVLLQTYRMRF